MSEKQTKSEEPNPAGQVADVIDNPAHTALETAEQTAEVVEQAAEQVIEEVDEHNTRETALERGISGLNQRMDGLEALIRGLQPTQPTQQEKKSDERTEPTEPTPETPRPPVKDRGKRIRLFRGSRNG